MLVYESKVNGEVLTEGQYDSFIKKEYEENKDDLEGETLEEYKAYDDSFNLYDADWKTNLGDYDLYIAREDDGNPYSAVIIKYHENINVKDKIRIYVVENDVELVNIEDLADSYDDADNADEKDVYFKGIEERAGI